MQLDHREGLHLIGENKMSDVIYLKIHIEELLLSCCPVLRHALFLHFKQTRPPYKVSEMQLL